MYVFHVACTFLRKVQPQVVARARRSGEGPINMGLVDSLLPSVLAPRPSPRLFLSS